MSKVTDEKLGLVKSHDTSLDNDYIQWIHELKKRFRNAQIKAAVKVNSEQLLFNWQLGRDLVTRRAEEKWGKGVVEQLSMDLQAEFPNVKGFSTSSVLTRSFLNCYEVTFVKRKTQIEFLFFLDRHDIPREILEGLRLTVPGMWPLCYSWIGYRQANGSP